MNRTSVKVKGKNIEINQDRLDLMDKGINDIAEIEGLEDLTSLKVLVLAGNFIEKITGLTHLKELETLNLSRNKIKEIQGLERLLKLKNLMLDHNLIEEIKGLDQLRNLDYIQLDQNKIREIKGLDNLERLSTLYLKHNSITEIKGLENLKSLTKLGLDKNTKINPQEHYLIDKPAYEVVNYCRKKKEKLTIFVLMPYQPEFFKLFEIIKAHLETQNIEVSKANDFCTPTPILDDIIRALENADIVIADLTGKNANVFYELGYRHALKKWAIQINQNENFIPFDVQHIRTIIYSSDELGHKKLIETLTNFIDEYRSRKLKHNSI